MRDFSAWPSIIDYLAWAAAQGCAVRVAAAGSRSARYRIATITAMDGRCAVEVFVDDADRLMSSTVARLDRRLCLKSAFFI